MPDRPAMPSDIRNPLMPPSLIGSGERALAGLPPKGAGPRRPVNLLDPANSSGANALMGGSPSGAELLGARLEPPVPPTAAAPAPAAAPVPVAPPAAPAALPGQEQANAIAQSMSIDKMPDAALAEEAERFEFMFHGLGHMLAQDDVTHANVVRLVGEAVDNGIIPPAQVSAVMRRISTDPKQLKGEVVDRYKFAVGGLIQIAAEQQRRQGAGQASTAPAAPGQPA